MRIYLFPGQGSQFVGMGKDWFDAYPEAKKTFEEASHAVNIDFVKLCMGGGTDDDLSMTEIAQPAILTTTVAIWRSLLVHSSIGDSLNSGAVFAGHSLGEYSALVCAGVLDFKQTLNVVRKRGYYMQQAVPPGKGGMVALTFKKDTPKTNELARKVCEFVTNETKSKIEVANYNTSEQIVLSGAIDAIMLLSTKKLPEEFCVRRVTRLPVSAPFHSSFMKPAAKSLLPHLKELSIRPMKNFYHIPNVDPDWKNLGDAGEQLRVNLAVQIYSSVKWMHTIKAAMSHDDISVTQAYEIGPGKVLTNMCKKIDYRGTYLPCVPASTIEDFNKGSSSED